MNHYSFFNFFAAMTSIRWPWNAQDLAQDDHQARRQHRAARTEPKAVFLVFHVLFIFGWEPVGPKPFFLKLKKWVSKKNKGLDENGSLVTNIYQKNIFSKKKLWPWSLGKNHAWRWWKTLNGQSKWLIWSTKVHSPLRKLYEFFLAKITKTLITQWILRVKRNWRDRFNLNLTEIIIVTCGLI
jgi:hypothetical protein